MTSSEASTCKLCRGDYAPSDSATVPGTTRDVSNRSWTVWRCSLCNSINALEAVDYDQIYRNYPIQRQKYDLFAKLLFAKRLKILIGAGLERGHSVLDYGCGSGHFVRYMQERGYKCEGYDPYSKAYISNTVLRRTYDFVVCQDVIEHVDDPVQFLIILQNLVEFSGCLVVGTPYSDNIDIHDKIDQQGVLHQPFHRFIVSKAQARILFSPSGWKLVRLVDTSYLSTYWPFANAMFLFHLFRCGDKTMDFAFDNISPFYILSHPSLLFWGFFGRLFARNQDLVAFVVRST